MSTTTLNAIRACNPCADGWEKLLAYLGKTKADDEPLALTTILDSNGLGNALWCLRTMPQHNMHWRLYAVWCARQVQHLMTDARSLAALDVAERHARGNATDDELAGARAEALVAVLAAFADTASAAAQDASMAVSANAARAATMAASWAAAYCGASWAAQVSRLREVCAEIDAQRGTA